MRRGGAARLGALVFVVSALCALGSVPSASAVGPLAREGDATVSILHAIPNGSGADVVDVYADSRLVAADLTPGRLRSVQVRSGTYDIEVYPDGELPGTAEPLLSAPGRRIAAGKNLTIAAHLSATGRPALTLFTNDTRTVGMGMGRITVRHIAYAPSVDVRSKGSTLLAGVRNTRAATIGVMAGGYPIAVVRAGTRDAVSAPTTVAVRNQPGRQDMGTNTIIYVWGSSSDGLRTAQQTIDLDLQ